MGEKMMYETKPDRGFVFKAFDLGTGDARIEVWRDGAKIRSFSFPTYKVWNIPAHADDIIRGELEKSDRGYRVAGFDGLGGNCYPGS